MLLRNKKTGEVFDVIVREKSNGDGEYSTIVCNLRSIRSARSVSPILGEYDSLDKLNEEWEDYKPAEPLIKDEKIRKAVRAWADVQGIKEVKHIEGIASSDFSHMFEYGGRGSNRGIIHWGHGVYISNLEDGKIYTIADLCGDE